jgi:hypothetical protein
MRVGKGGKKISTLGFDHLTSLRKSASPSTRPKKRICSLRFLCLVRLVHICTMFSLETKMRHLRCHFSRLNSGA